MTLLDAPQFDAARARRNTLILRICAGVAGRAVRGLVAGGEPAR